MKNSLEIEYADPGAANFESISQRNEIKRGILKEKKRWEIWLAIIVTIFFWVPDTYMLYQHNEYGYLMTRFGIPLCILGSAAIRLFVWRATRRQLATGNVVS
jgi:hypothetical protein